MAKKTTTAAPTTPKAKRIRKSPTLSPRDRLEAQLQRLETKIGTYLVPKYKTAAAPFADTIREAQLQLHTAKLLVRGFADDWALSTKARGRAPLAVGDWVEPKDGTLPFFGQEPRRVIEIDGAYLKLDCGESGNGVFARKLVKKIVRAEAAE